MRESTNLKRLRELNQQAKVMAKEELTEGEWDWNIATNKLVWCNKIYDMFRTTPLKFGATYEAFLNFVHPQDREYVKTAVDEALTNEKRYDICHRVVVSNGSIHTVRERAKVYFDENGKAVRMKGTVRDVTESRRLNIPNPEVWEKIFESMESELQRQDRCYIRLENRVWLMLASQLTMLMGLVYFILSRSQ